MRTVSVRSLDRRTLRTVAFQRGSLEHARRIAGHSPGRSSQHKNCQAYRECFLPLHIEIVPRFVAGRTSLLIPELSDTEDMEMERLNPKGIACLRVIASMEPFSRRRTPHQCDNRTWREPVVQRS
jgi:hypothetical protein